MAQNFYTKWQNAILADAGAYVSKEYRKFVYISHSSGLSRIGRSVKIEPDSFLIRTAQHAKDYRGGHNQYCDITNLQSMIDNLLE